MTTIIVYNYFYNNARPKLNFLTIDTTIWRGDVMMYNNTTVTRNTYEHELCRMLLDFKKQGGCWDGEKHGPYNGMKCLTYGLKVDG